MKCLARRGEVGAQTPLHVKVTCLFVFKFYIDFIIENHDHRFQIVKRSLDRLDHSKEPLKEMLSPLRMTKKVPV